MDPDNSQPDIDESNELSRRTMLGLGLAAAAGGTALALGGFPGIAGAAPDSMALIGATVPGYSYLGLDAFAFLDDNGERLYQTITGTQSEIISTKRIWAPLGLPAGTIIKELAVSCQGQPIIEISRRPFFDGGVQGTIPAQVFQQTVPAQGGGARTSTLATNVVVDPNYTYTISAYLLTGESIYNVRVGYQGGFVPYTGANPRVLDTRTPAQGPILAVGTPRKVSLGLPGRAAVFNLTATDGPGAGNIAAYASGIPYPGNSSVNFAPGRNVANLVICAMNASGEIDLRAGFSPTHAIVDLVGSIF